MAVVLGNVALLLDPNHVSSSRSNTLPDRKVYRPVVPVLSDVVLNIFRKEPVLTSNILEFNREIRKDVKKGKLKSKVNEVEYENSSDDENGNGNGFGNDDDEQEFDWEKEMRKRRKEIEEMKELEKTAEELQYKVDEEFKEGEDKEETEEEKRMRVRKELEKVTLFNFWLRIIYSIRCSVYKNISKLCFV